MIKLSKTRDCRMRFLQRLKSRFCGDKVTLYVDDCDLAWYLQMGWVEKVWGKYVVTQHGEHALHSVMIRIKENDG